MELKGLERLGDNSESFDNKIALCKDCHSTKDYHTTKEDYLEGANEVVTSASSKHKQEAEDGDDIYYDAENNEIVFVSKDGYIRTYFKPSDGIEYYNRQ